MTIDTANWRTINDEREMKVTLTVAHLRKFRNSIVNDAAKIARQAIDGNLETQQIIERIEAIKKEPVKLLF